MTQKLAAKVKAINKAHKYANELWPTLAEMFRPLVGERITKVDGTLFAKIVKDFPKFTNTHDLQVYRHGSNYSLAWTVKTSEMDSLNTCCYYETTLYVGDIDNGVLTKMSEPYTARTDWTSEEVVALRLDYKEKKKLADNALSALCNFGEYDR